MSGDDPQAALSDAQCAAVVLVVDDEPMVLRVCRRILRLGNYEVFTAESAGQAMSLVEDDAHHFDLLICDVMMPEMSGGKLARQVLGLRPQLKLIFISGHNDDEQALEMIGAGDAQFIHKPFMADELLEAVGQILSA